MDQAEELASQRKPLAVLSSLSEPFVRPETLSKEQLSLKLTAQGNEYEFPFLLEPDYTCDPICEDRTRAAVIQK